MCRSHLPGRTTVAPPCGLAFQRPGFAPRQARALGSAWGNSHCILRQVQILVWIRCPGVPHGKAAWLLVYRYAPPFEFPIFVVGARMAERTVSLLHPRRTPTRRTAHNSGTCHCRMLSLTHSPFLSAKPRLERARPSPKLERPGLTEVENAAGLFGREGL